MHGERSVVDVIDAEAINQPQVPCYSIPNSLTDPSQGWRDLSFADMFNSVNRAAHYLLKLLGKPDGSLPVFAYVGPNDIRYMLLVLGAAKAGYRAFLISPRNPLEAQLSLFEASKTIAFLHADEYTSLMKSLLDVATVPCHIVPSQEEFIDATPVEKVTYAAATSTEELAHRHFVVLHTSGSTGTPKPVYLRHGSFMALDRWNDIQFTKPPFTDRFRDAERYLMSMPLFHGAGMIISLSMAMYYSLVITLPLSGRPIATDIISKTIEHSKVDCGILPPSILNDLSFDEEAMDRLATLKFIITGGGPSSAATGERLVSRKVFPVNWIGATEGMLPPLDLTPQDFPSLHFDAEAMGLDWQPAGNDGDLELYRMVIKRLPDYRHQPWFYTFPDLTEYDTQDIFSKVKGKPGFWRYYGRSDDVIVFSNGEKLNPLDIEAVVADLPNVKGAVVVGQSQFQAGLFVELEKYPEDESAKQAAIDQIWTTVEKINLITVKHGRVEKDMIRLATPGKPLPRAGKGTVQRAAAYKIYKPEIDALYASIDEKLDDNNVVVITLDYSSREKFAESIRNAFSTTLDLRSETLTLDTDLFAVGIDSMQVLKVSRSIKGALAASNIQVDPEHVSAKAIYSGSTPRGIANALWGRIKPEEANGINGTNGQSNGDNSHELEDLVARFTADLPKPSSPSAQASASSDQTYMITGTTGAIGPYLLDIVLKSSPSGKVFALNRNPDAAKRQLAAHESRGLSTDFSRVTFLTSDLSQPSFGVSSEELALMKLSVTRIIHSAWPVNFNIPVASFIPHIAGVRNIIDFCAESPNNPHITFISTVGSAMMIYGDIDEGPLSLKAAGLGYGQSKAVSSTILDVARERGFSAATIRVGQVAGPIGEKGEWNKLEWLPRIVGSSAGMGMLPDSLGGLKNIDWVPVETVAGVIHDVSKAAANGYYHAVNPSSTNWQALLPALQTYFGDRVQTVSLAKWLEELQTRSEKAVTDADIEKVPGIKLLDFYQGLLFDPPVKTFRTEKTCDVSPTLRNVGAVKPEWMQNWARQWNY